MDSVEGDLAETENSLAGDEASSEWEECQKSRVESPQLMRRFLWPCDSMGGCAQRRVWLACKTASDSMGGRAHSAPFFAPRTKESNAFAQAFFHVKAWTTDRDLESHRHEKVNARKCARPTTHHDSDSVARKKKKKTANL